MRAARFYKAGDVRIEDIDPPAPTDDKVLVAVEWCGICGSDLYEYSSGPFSVPHGKTGPHRLTGDVVPVTMGHELTGRITHVPGSYASSLTQGQKVVIDPRLYCRTCTPCTSSITNVCDSLGFLGLSGGGGGLSETVAVSPSMLHVLPDDTDLAAAALIEPLAVAWHAVKLSGPRRDLGTDPILVVGAGPVGVATVFVLRAWGARTILVSEPSRARREAIAGKVHAALDPAEVDVGAKCREVSPDGVVMVFDCAGCQPGVDAGCGALRFRGQYINLAIPKSIVPPLLLFFRKELVYKFSLAYDKEDFEETVATFVAGGFEGVERMITRQVSLEDIVEKGFKELIKPNDHIKIMATPRKDLVVG